MNLYITNFGKNVIIREPANDIYGAWDCDEEVYPLLRALWNKKYETAYSCSGHVVRVGRNSNTVVNQPDCDCYIMFETNTVNNDISRLKTGWAYVQKKNEWDSIFTVAEKCGIDIPSWFERDINNLKVSQFVYNVVKKSGGDYGLYLEKMKRLKDEATTYILRARIPNRTEKKLIDNDASYIEWYKKLLKCRSDLMKLVEMLPENVKIEED